MHLFKRAKLRYERNVLGRKTYRGYLTIDQVVGLSKETLLNLLDMGFQLPIAGGTSPQNQQAGPATLFPRAIVVSSDQTINQGDAVWWDAVNFTLKPCTTFSQVAVSTTGGFCGAAAGTNAPGVYPTPPSGVSENLSGIEVQRGGSVFWNATITDRGYYPFQIVTMSGVDAQTVTGDNVQTAADAVGYVLVSPPVNARSGPGATPVPELDTNARVQVWLRPTYPTAALI